MATVTELRPDRHYSTVELRAGARAILEQGRLQLLHVSAHPSGAVSSVVGRVYGHTGAHDVCFDVGAGWSCSCPVRGLCHHVVAAELVTHGAFRHGTAQAPKR